MRTKYEPAEPGYISLTDYAALHGCRSCEVRRKARNGDFQTAKKDGSSWMIKPEEPYIDRRVTTGNCRNWRKK